MSAIIEPWHPLETVPTEMFGHAQVLSSSGECEVGCLDPGCRTMNAFIRQDVSVLPGKYRMRARTTENGTFLEVERLGA
jgi:hypothetical protein